ncbi:MAG: hypothetical protein E7311_02670 [Clostridiales bacterium]|nr:hypothetical protein [Clostridiales bacterium]
MKRFIYNGLILTITSLLVRIIGMFFNIYVTNIVGSEAIGVFHIIMSVYLLGITFATSGISLSCTKIISEKIAKNKENEISSVTNICLKISLIVSIITAIIIIVFREYITKTWLFNKVSSQVLIYIGTALPFIAMTAVIDGYFLAVKRVAKSAIDDVWEVSIKIIVTIILFVKFGVTNIEKSCLYLIIGDVISEIAAFSLIFVFYILDIRKYKEGKKSNYISKILRISMPVAISSYIRSGLSTLKQILIPIMLQKSGIALQMSMSLYGIINGMVFPIILFPNFIIMAFSSLLIPEFSEFNAKNEYTKMNKVIERIFRYLIFFSLYVIGIFIFMAEDISYMLYNSYEAIYYIQILSPLVVFMYLDNIVDSILKGLDKQVTVMIINIIDLISSILCIILFIPMFGMKGYIFVIFFSTILNSSISVIQIKKTIKMDTNNYINLYKIFISSIISWIIYLLFSIHTKSLIEKILIYSIIYVTIYYIKHIHTNTSRGKSRKTI